jgi:hypothetical protein
MTKIVMDVWGGDQSTVHVARFIRTYNDAIEIAKTELDAGYLVNLRAEAAWGNYEDFDTRTQQKGKPNAQSPRH